ncbi:nucleotide pyrophosphohydrolase [Nocardia mexicana]|uniref:NTP pyrophosphatase (Non-canonical NTP hydrolase) n=1 Tax=Nocardia mexicana TaxID=279262 RepID=A0A370GS79_9NOCA|nr:nucleotide pyrophosphohydrolase [Nocardia mexicana]RDI46361.1 NTP pyrophosphatase (non-canonical NTP hydrolase) [Nocardia mexicana]
MEIDRLQALIADFAAQREWQKFHTPKNLVMALTGEVGELSELFQWLTAEESMVIHTPERRARVADEIADVFIYLLRLADVLDIDLVAATESKLQTNAQRYPAEAVRGRAVKYSDLDSSHGSPNDGS